MKPDYSVKSLGRSALWSVLNQSLGQFLVFFVFLVTARFVSKEAFGLMAMAMLSIEFFRQILIESMATTFYAKQSPSTQDYNAGFCLILLGALLSALFVFVFSQALADLFEHNEVASTLRWISLLLLTTGLSKMHEIWLTRQLQFRALAFRSMVSISLGGVVGVLLAIEGYGLLSLIAQQIVTAVIAVIWLWMASAWRPSLDFQWQHVASILKVGKFVSLNAIASFLGGQGDLLLSSLYLGPAATGIYSAAKRLLTAITLIVGSGLNSVALPALASCAVHEEKLASAYLTGIRLTTLLTAPLYAALAVFAPDVIALLMGDNWSEVAPVLAILALIGFNRSITQYSINILLIRHKAHWLTVLAILDAALNMVLLFIVARYGLIYLAGAFAAKTLLLAPVTAGIALRLLGLRYADHLRQTFLSTGLALLVAIMMGITRALLDMSALFNLILLIPVGAGLYWLLFLLFDKPTLLQATVFMKETLRKAG
jgi:O-antigen/teichoic acid export membrane protein